jgi:hypothetical protein
MPTVLRVHGFRFFFFSNECGEPAHVHVERAESYAKIWLDPIMLECSFGFRSGELSEIQRLVLEHRTYLQERWNEFFSHQD